MEWFTKNKWLVLMALIALSLFFAFYKLRTKTEVATAFYHWKTTLNLTETLLLKNKNTPLYLHCFDVDWDEERSFVVPIATLDVQKPLPEDFPVVPVIYITNRCFENISDKYLEAMAESIWERIEQVVLQSDEFQVQIEAVQFDCDWTLTTKDKYFAFLEKIKSYCPVPLSATIRLHQLKYALKTGVPPVDNGMLMFYNMGDLDNPNTQNSILDLATAKQYLTNAKQYPLPLDVALPLFQWAVVLRDGKVVELLSAASRQSLKSNEFLEKTDNGQYKVIESTYVHGFYCYEGDQIRLETVTQSQLEAAADMLADALKKEKRTVCFYHLDFDLLQSFPDDALKKIRAAMRQ
jgi:hypothetical protein